MGHNPGLIVVPAGPESVMTRLLHPPEEGWRGRFSFIQQILRSAFRIPDQTNPRIRAVLDKIEGRAGKGGDHGKAASHGADRPGSEDQARERSRRH